jgi:hypothetical protein
MVIGNKEKAVFGFLHSYKVFHRTKIIPQMQITGTTNATNYCFLTHDFIYFFTDENILINGGESKINIEYKSPLRIRKQQLEKNTFAAFLKLKGNLTSLQAYPLNEFSTIHSR